MTHSVWTLEDYGWNYMLHYEETPSQTWNLMLFLSAIDIVSFTRGYDGVYYDATIKVK